MQLENRKDKGRAGLSVAIAYFGCNGYTVSIPLNDTQAYDLVIEKNGEFQSVQCKFGGGPCRNNEDAYMCGLRSIGAKGTVHGNVKESKVDLLFCLRPDGVMYVIPRDVLPNVNEIRLTTRKSENCHGFDASEYIVKI